MKCQKCGDYAPLRTNQTEAGGWLWVCAWCDENPPWECSLEAYEPEPGN